jgi:long-chain fatty acid transport protein
MRAASLAFIAVSVCAGGAAAQTDTVFNRTGSGARAAGMANAFIAVSDDGTAASWNPAGLAQLRKPEFSIVSSTTQQTGRSMGFRTLDDSAVFTPITASYRSTFVDFASLAIPTTILGKPFTFQSSWQRLYTLDFRSNTTTVRTPLTPAGPPPLEIARDQDTTGSVNLLSLAAAFKLTPRLALGGSFNFWRGDWDQSENERRSPVESLEPSSFRSTVQTNRLRGTNASLGLLLTYPRFSVGVQYQRPVNGDFDVSAVGWSSTAEPGGPFSASGRARFPQALAVGGAFRPAPRWTVALDFTWDDWTDSLITDDAGGEPISIFDGLPAEFSGTRDTLSVHSGAECLFYGEGFVVPLRFGVAWEPQGSRSAYTREPARHLMLALGTGYNTNALKFDAALQYRRAAFLDGAGFGLADESSYLPLAVGERRLSEWRVKLSVIVRVTDTDALRRRFKKLVGS